MALIKKSVSLAVSKGRKIPKIDYESSGFHSAALNGKFTLEVPIVDLVKAAITYGRYDKADLQRHGSISEAEIISRALRLRCLLVLKEDRFIKSDFYETSDKTEKAYFSYFLGMTICKLFAWKKLGVPWLFHTSRATVNGHTLAYHNPQDKSEPDFLGMMKSSTTGRQEWVIAEAKGRTGQFDANALQKAVDQADKIQSVNGFVPVASFGLESYFTPALKFKVVDPEPDFDASEVEIQSKDALQQYYYFRELLEIEGRNEQLEFDNVKADFKVLDIPEVGLSVGLMQRIADANAFDDLSDLNNIFKNKESADPTRDASPSSAPDIVEERIYDDGILIRLGSMWSVEEFEKQPISFD